MPGAPYPRAGAAGAAKASARLELPLQRHRGQVAVIELDSFAALCYPSNSRPAPPGGPFCCPAGPRRPLSACKLWIRTYVRASAGGAIKACWAVGARCAGGAPERNCRCSSAQAGRLATCNSSASGVSLFLRVILRKHLREACFSLSQVLF